MLLKKFTLSMTLCMALIACESDAERAEGHYQRGLELMAEGDEARARIEFRNALQQEATHIDARLELARLNYEDGSLRPAFRNYLRVAEQDPNNLEAQVKLGEMAFMIKNWDAFERHTGEAIRLASDDANVRLLDLASRYRNAALAEDRAARQSLLAEAEALEAEFPDNEILRQILIDGYTVSERYDAALAQIEKSIQATPEDVDLYFAKIRLLGTLNDEDAVEDELRRMVATFPDEDRHQSNLLRFLISRDKGDEAESFLRDQAAAAPAGDTSSFVTLIQFLLATDKRAEAATELENAVAANPDALDLRALNASLKFDNGQRDVALAEMQRIVDNAPEDADTEQMDTIKVTLATMLATNGNEVGARRLVEQILTDNPSVVGALKMQARWMVEDDDTEGAINAMRAALAESPEDSEAMTIMAEAYQRTGDKALMLDFLSLANDASGNAPEEALRYATALAAEDRLTAAEATLLDSLRLQSANTEVLTLLGNIYLEQKDSGRLRQVIDALEDIATPEAMAQARRLEVALLGREDGADAVMSYLEALAASPEQVGGADIALIQARLQNNEPEAARDLAQELVANNPDNLSYAYFLGLTEAATGDISGAKETMAAVVAAAPGADLAWLQLAKMQMIDDASDDVLKTLNDGIAANPQSGNLLWAKASYLQEQSDIDGAIEIYSQLYEQNSASVIVANNLASLLATFRSDPESLERATLIARRLQGTEVPALMDTYGWILFRNGDTEGALEYLEPAAAGLPEDATVQYHLGRVYKELGRKDEALAQMRKAIERVGPLGSAELVDEIRAKIAELEASSDN
ncbi:tetratricopeptide repeat protein [uncultured Roseobacter sp.]|uniref:tetratricopeptide repeat protein n=1 Tax=uncultured Roseobacter sp. TaxID=114847 RepID=UPI00262CFC05|nr:tetratricopeptide repeat protein [uncultured Roseobacter sp.]